MNTNQDGKNKKWMMMMPIIVIAMMAIIHLTPTAKAENQTFTLTNNYTLDVKTDKVIITAKNITREFPNTGNYTYYIDYTYTQTLDVNSTNHTYIYNETFNYDRIRRWIEDNCEANRTTTLQENFTAQLKQDMQDIIQSRITDATTILTTKMDNNGNLQIQKDACILEKQRETEQRLECNSSLNNYILKYENEAKHTTELDKQNTTKNWMIMILIAAMMLLLLNYAGFLPIRAKTAQFPHER